MLPLLQGKAFMGICFKFSCAGLLLGLASVLSGCAVHDTDVAHYTKSAHGQPAHQIVGDPDFNWHLSGDRRVAPRQVFSDQGRIWLQWHAHQAVPTIFVEHLDGWQVVDQHPHGQYTVIEGSWQRLRFQGAQMQAMAAYRQAGATPCVNTSVSQPTGFDVRVSDGSIRQALRRWSEQANWFFDDAHWSLSVDFPITAPAVFNTDFELAVRGLLESARISGQAVKPCFYANHVLRVIPAAQSCDPMADQGDRP
jgi:hypothetical protein